MQKTKICSRCGEEKLLISKNFYKDSNSSSGYRSDCKVCSVKNDKRKYEANKKRVLHQKREYYIDNKNKISEYDKKYREENKIRLSEYQKAYRLKNKDRIKEINKKYNQENKDKQRIHKQKYKARKKKLPNTLTLKEWNKIKRDFNNSCSYCGMTEKEHIKIYNEQLHQEHFIPVVNGGEYTLNNIIPTCKSCNSSKNDRDFFEWYPKYLHYNKERENRILKYLGYEDKTQQLSILL